jgi:hypothetical protein
MPSTLFVDKQLFATETIYLCFENFGRVFKPAMKVRLICFTHHSDIDAWLQHHSSQNSKHNKTG